jgi:hypothetical protein
MQLLAYRRDERYPTAELAVRDLVRCQDAPRDGRGDLVRLLDERFPRARRQSPLSHLGPPVTALRTVTDLLDADGRTARAVVGGAARTANRLAGIRRER